MARIWIQNVAFRNLQEKLEKVEIVFDEPIFQNSSLLNDPWAWVLISSAIYFRMDLVNPFLF